MAGRRQATGRVLMTVRLRTQDAKEPKKAHHGGTEDTEGHRGGREGATSSGRAMTPVRAGRCDRLFICAWEACYLLVAVLAGELADALGACLRIRGKWV